MNFEQLSIFVRVFRAGGFAPVAADLNVAPSSISRAVSALEETLQARLFQRTTRKLTATAAGESLYRRIAPLLEELEAARTELVDAGRGPSGHLKVTASVSFGQIVIAPKLKRFHDQYKDISLELVLSDRTIDLIDERVDLAIRHGSLPDSSLIVRKLRDVHYFAVASPAYLVKAPPLDHPRDIAAHTVVTFSYDGFRSGWRFRNASETVRVPIRPAATVTNAIAIRQLARDGMGIALLADWTVETDLANGSLVRVLDNWTAAGASFESSVSMVFPSRAHIPEKTRVFMDFLSAET